MKAKFKTSIISTVLMAILILSTSAYANAPFIKNRTVKQMSQIDNNAKKIIDKTILPITDAVVNDHNNNMFEIMNVIMSNLNFINEQNGIATDIAGDTSSKTGFATTDDVQWYHKITTPSETDTAGVVDSIPSKTDTAKRISQIDNNAKKIIDKTILPTYDAVINDYNDNMFEIMHAIMSNWNIVDEHNDISIGMADNISSKTGSADADGIKWYHKITTPSRTDTAGIADSIPSRTNTAGVADSISSKTDTADERDCEIDDDDDYCDCDIDDDNGCDDCDIDDGACCDY